MVELLKKALKSNKALKGTSRFGGGGKSHLVRDKLVADLATGLVTDKIVGQLGKM